MALCNADHDAHHSRQRPISFDVVPDAALEFAEELLGRDGAEAYWLRYYSLRWV
jgi:hypothetical protein